MTIFSRLIDRFFPAAVEGLESDLIDHPIFRSMSMRDLADLPFPRPAPREWSEDGVGTAEKQPMESHEIRPAA